MRAESIFNRWTNFYWNFLFLYLDQFITKLSVSLFAYSVVKVDTRRLRVYTMLQFNFIIYFKRTWIYPITAWAFNKLLFGYFFSLQGLLGFLLRSIVRAVLVAVRIQFTYNFSLEMFEWFEFTIWLHHQKNKTSQFLIFS